MIKLKKSYVTTMPDHIGAFLRASRCFAALGINITRVSYNKAVDAHTLFIDAEGTEEQLRRADAQLAEIGYLQKDEALPNIVLMEFCLKDEPGAVTAVLELIHRFAFNISYISSTENGTEFQFFKMGLYVEDSHRISAFLDEAEKLCRVRVIDYNRAEKVFDNSIFYRTYVDGLARTANLTEEQRQALTVYVNLAMQTLDEKGLSPYRTFDSIHRFAQLLAAAKGDAFDPRISRHPITDRTEIILIEPPCGSNTTIIRSGDSLLFVDSGYACYTEEMLPLLRELLPEFDTVKKSIFLTHADVDHCGLLPLFDEIIVSHRTALCLQSEHTGENGYREENPLHRPYVHICKILTAYTTPDPGKLVTPWEYREELREPLTQIGFFDFGDLHFEVYEGKGGHIPGETVLIDYDHNLAFTGDIYINLKDLTPRQAEYNQYAPILMTSVDTESALCTAERRAVLRRLGVGDWKIFSGHGNKKDYCVR